VWPRDIYGYTLFKSKLTLYDINEADSVKFLPEQRKEKPVE
jgi:hypothetical protein